MDWNITVITYNVAMRICDETTVENLLDGQIEDSTQLVAIGLQEVLHGETILGASVTWCRAILERMNESVKMVLLAKNYQATNQVFLYGRKQIIPLIKKIDFRFAKNTMGGLTGHKGSIGVRVQLRSPFSLVFVDSHFVHNVAAYQKRIAQFHTNRNCSFPEDKSVRACFWFGDLNFRVEEETEIVMRKIKMGAFLDLQDTREQLKRALVEGDAFRGFQEQPIKFAPTYRLIVGSDEHDAKRTPSWCDRVLYKGDGITPMGYSANCKALGSDHLPVIAKFKVQAPVAPKSHWAVIFEQLPTWYSSIPLIGRFQVDAMFTKEMASFRDWIGVFPSSIDDCTSCVMWLYVATCFEQTIEDEKYLACEFNNISPGEYRLGYVSTYSNCIVGLSKSFRVIEPE